VQHSTTTLQQHRTNSHNNIISNQSHALPAKHPAKQRGHRASSFKGRVTSNEASEAHHNHKNAPTTSHLKCLGEKVGRERGPSLGRWGCWIGTESWVSLRSATKMVHCALQNPCPKQSLTSPHISYPKLLNTEHQGNTFNKDCDAIAPLLPRPASWTKGLPWRSGGSRDRGHHDALQGGMATPAGAMHRCRKCRQGFLPLPCNRTPTRLWTGR
jgi:hypothetical protein